MARWKVRIELLLNVSCGWGATRQNVSKLAAFGRGWVTLSQDFRGRGSSLGNIFFGFYKTRRHILLSDSANCIVLRTCRRFDTIPACDGWRRDRQTDGIAVANTALAMRALRCAVKTTRPTVRTSRNFLYALYGPPPKTMEHVTYFRFYGCRRVFP